MFSWGLLALALLLLVFVRFMPRLVRLRIRLLKWLHWRWAANLLEKHFAAWVLFFRVLVLAIAALLVFFALGGLANASASEPADVPGCQVFFVKAPATFSDTMPNIAPTTIERIVGNSALPTIAPSPSTAVPPRSHRPAIDAKP